MTFLSPIAGLLAAGIAIPLLVLLYFLKLRRRPVVISTTLLWKRSLHDMQVNAPFQKLRKNLLLLLQLTILLALLAAFARPTFRAAAQAGDRLVIVLDHSASMNATDIAPDRLAHAKELALQVVDEFTGSGGVMVVSCANAAQVVQPFTTDKTLVRSAIHAIAPTDGLSRLSPALQLIEPYAVTRPGNAAAAAAHTPTLTAYIFSDGRFQDESALALRGADLQYVPIGKAAPTDSPDNLAIIAVAARRDFARPQHVEVFAWLANYGPKPVQTNVTLSVDGRVSKVLPVEVPGAIAGASAGSEGKESDPEGFGWEKSGKLPEGLPGERAVTFELTLPRSALLCVAHDHEDILPADNVAWLNLAPPRQMRVLLISEGNAFLERVLESLGIKKLTLMTPKRYEDQDPTRLRRDLTDGAAGFDVLVFDGYAPKSVPPVDSVYFGAAPPIKGLERKATTAGEARTQVILDWRRDDPLLRYVALDDVLLVEPGRLALPEDAAPLAIGQAGPVMAEISEHNVRHVVLSFPLLQTNWPMQVSFAVFMSNCLDVLSLTGGTGAPLAFRPGDVAVVPAGTTLSGVRYDGPVALTAAVEQGRAVLPMFERVGVYRAAQGIDPPWDQLPVNLCNVVESDPRPAPRLQVGTSVIAPAARQASLHQEVWPWFIWAALAVLLLEWVVYTRRMHL